MIKRILSLVLTLAMVTVILPTMVFADPMDDTYAVNGDANYFEEYTFIGDEGIAITVPKDGVYQISAFNSSGTRATFIFNGLLSGSKYVRYLTADKTYEVLLSWSSSYVDSSSYTLIVESFSDSGTCGDNIEYTFDFDGTLSIRGNGAMYDYDTESSHETPPPWYSYELTIKSVIIGEGITYIGKDSFFSLNYGPNISYISLPTTLESIGDSAFRSAIGSISITLPRKLTEIGEFAFAYCDLTDIDLPDSLQEIKSKAFLYCDLTVLDIPDSVKNIKDKAFYDNSISELNLGNGVETIGNQAFGYNDITEVTIPASLQIMDGAFYGCENLKSININENNLYFKSEDGVVYSKDGKSLIICPPAIEKEGIFYIPAGTEVISAGAFCGCTKLTSIMIPEGVTTLGDSFAASCDSLESIYIPSTVTNIVMTTFFTSLWYHDEYISDLYYGGSEEEWNALIETAGCWQTFYGISTTFHWNATGITPQQIANITVLLNNTALSFDQPPTIIDDRTMVPIRAIFEAMGYTVEWDSDTQTAAAVNGEDSITVQIGNDTISYVTNGQEGTYICDVPPQIVSDRTLVPVRAIAESAGCNVDWDGQTQTVSITTL